MPEMKTQQVQSPCPFCGKPVSIKDGSENLVLFVCETGSDCIGSGLVVSATKSNLDQAIGVWNRRVSLPEQTALADAAKLLLEHWETARIDSKIMKLGLNGEPRAMLRALSNGEV